MSDQIIRQALSAHLNSMPPGWDVQWTDTSYSPVTGTPYLQEALLPAQTFQADLGASGRNRHSGIYQLTIVTPRNRLKDAEDKQTALIAHFKRGTRLTRNGVTVTLEAPFVGPAMQEADWIRRPLSIPYFAYLDNPA